MTGNPLGINVERVAAEIARALVSHVRGTLRRKGLVVGLSGGVDSSVVAALAARALGPNHVLALSMPDCDSSAASHELAQLVATRFAIPLVTEDLGPALEGIGCYDRQTEAIRTVFPEYGPGWTCQLSPPSILGVDRLSVTVQSPKGARRTSRLTPEAYRLFVAATNMKQRMRKTMEYFHADRLGYAVAGTPNRLEYDQGFFVKQGDGAADVKPIAHLYETQVYALAEHLGVPEEVRLRAPATSTFSMSQTQEDSLALPYEKMDLCLWALNHGVLASAVAATLGLDEEQVDRVYEAIEAKRRTTRYLHAPPLLVDEVPEIAAQWGV